MQSNWAENAIITHYTIQMLLLAVATGEWQRFMAYEDRDDCAHRPQSLGANVYSGKD